MPWLVTDEMLLSNMSFDVLDPGSQEEMLAIFDESFGSYLQGRYNLYDFMRQSPPNEVEPYSGIPCLLRLLLSRRPPATRPPPTTPPPTTTPPARPPSTNPPSSNPPRPPNRQSDDDALRDFFGDGKGSKPPNPERAKDVSKDALEEYKKKAEEAIEKYKKLECDPTKKGDYKKYREVQEDRLNKVNEELKNAKVEKCSIRFVT